MKYDYEKSFDAFPYEKYESLSDEELEKLEEQEIEKSKSMKNWPEVHRF